MNSNKTLLVIVSTVAVAIGLAIPTLAQTAGGSAPVSAGSSMDRAGTDSENAAKNVYNGTTTALEDTKITTEVKTAFASGKDIKSDAIHVTTTAGIVTLSGKVQNADMATRVERIARDTSGVRGVKNELRLVSSSSQD